MTHTPSRGLTRIQIGTLVAPATALAALSLPLVVYLPEYYTATLGLNLALVGTIFMVVRSADIGFDPLFGAFMDRHHTRLGRYRPWLLLACPVIMLAVAMLFMARPGVGAVYLAVWLGVAYVGYSILSLAQMSLVANVSHDYNERSTIYAWWQSAFAIGMMSAMLAPKLLASIGVQTPAQRMAAMAWLVIIATPIAGLAAFFSVRERPVRETEQRHGLRDYLALMGHNTVRRLLSCEALMGLASGTTSTLAIFFFTRAKGLSHADVGLLLIANAVASLVTTGLWSRLARTIGKHRALTAACLLNAFALCLMAATPAGNFTRIISAQLLVGTCYGAVSLLPRAMMADINDQLRLVNKADQTALLYSLLISIWKIGQALSVGLIFWALALIGFDVHQTAPHAPGAQAGIEGLYGLYIALPITLCLVSAWVAWHYPLTRERHAEIMRELAVRDGIADKG